eukprot:TRINITY_DN2820_c0_g4_i2.p1 TRINITY_DN2820_c0_g4~~TRINITY_DN2820_c0_g4_i2.p1  ORF type:complete len:397 (-),score=26.86 TRINITY_DN2820_c0_g4_i2:266-1366(-)
MRGGLRRSTNPPPITPRRMPSQPGYRGSPVPPRRSPVRGNLSRAPSRSPSRSPRRGSSRSPARSRPIPNRPDPNRRRSLSGNNPLYRVEPGNRTGGSPRGNALKPNVPGRSPVTTRRPLSARQTIGGSPSPPPNRRTSLSKSPNDTGSPIAQPRSVSSISRSPVGARPLANSTGGSMIRSPLQLKRSTSTMKNFGNTSIGGGRTNSVSDLGGIGGLLPNKVLPQFQKQQDQIDAAKAANRKEIGSMYKTVVMGVLQKGSIFSKPKSIGKRSELKKPFLFLRLSADSTVIYSLEGKSTDEMSAFFSQSDDEVKKLAKQSILVDDIARVGANVIDKKKTAKRVSVASFHITQNLLLIVESGTGRRRGI